MQSQGRAAVEVDAAGMTLTWRGAFVAPFPNEQIESADEVFSAGTCLEAAPSSSLTASGSALQC